MPRQAIAVLALLLAACAAGETPESQVRAFVARGEQAVEKRSVVAARDMISGEYADDRGRSRRDIVQLLMAYFHQHRQIHLLTRIHELHLIDPTHARVTVHVGMAGVPIETADQLHTLRADVYRFDVALAKEDDQWLLQRAWWRRIRPSDFFPP